MKKVFSHSLPVTRVIYAEGKGDKETTIIHLSKEIHKEDVKNGQTYWHTPCGKNIEWHRSPMISEMQHAVAGRYGYKLCPHCGTLEDFMNLYALEVAFDRQRKIDEQIERDAERSEREASWNKMMTILDEECCDILDKRKWYSDEKYSSVKYYIVKRDGKEYRVEVTIKENKEANQ